MDLEISLDQLSEAKFLLADGATGTNLFLKGLLTGDAPELWNLKQSKKIAELHKDFLEAGETGDVIEVRMAMANQNVSINPGDVVIFHTGWTQHKYESAPANFSDSDFLIAIRWF